VNESQSTPPPPPEPSAQLAFDAWCIAGFGVSLIAFWLLVTIVRNHEDSHHVSFSPWDFSIVFLPTAIVGFRAMRRGMFRVLALLALLSGSGGMAYLYYLDHTGRLISYMEYLWRCKNKQ
jgi:hypothetical protein